MTDRERSTDSTPDPVAQPGSEQGHEQPDDLTVDDILNTAQTAGAKSGGGAAASASADAAASASPGSATPGDPQPDAECAASAETSPYLEDLRRITAEYANYRKRTEANAQLEKQRATASVVSSLLTVLDDLDRAEQHGDLAEGSAFLAIAQKIRGTLERLGLESYGEKGEPFDPQLHEAVAQVPVPGTEQHAVLDVIERGYRLGGVELRPAKVAVAVGSDG